MNLYYKSISGDFVVLAHSASFTYSLLLAASENDSDFATTSAQYKLDPYLFSEGSHNLEFYTSVTSLQLVLTMVFC